MNERRTRLRMRFFRAWVTLLATGFFFFAVAPSFSATNLSTWVFPGPSGRILQKPDALGNRVLDYSSVGYKGGAAPIPEVAVKATVSPVAGDDTASIQAAINAVKALPSDSNGFRGAVLLTAGEYQLSNTITINGSGVVLRGVGSGTNGTVLRATATNAYTLVQVTGSGSASTVGGTTHNITNTYVPVGASSFNVESTSGLAAGDRVFVHRNATQEWIDYLGMNLLDNPWTPSGYGIDFDRIITRIEGTRIFVNAPITTAIEARYMGGTIRKYTWSSRIMNCGVERIRGVSDFVAPDDENHGWTFVQLSSVENAWVREVTSQYFGYSCVALMGGTRFVTVRDCRSLDPVSIITGGRRYAFVLDDCTFCLVQNCYTDEDRHQFVTQSLTTGPNVYVDGQSDTAKSDAGPHHRWGSGALWDNIAVNGNALDIQNRGNAGTGHGWSGANEVAYNCFASSGYVVQNPPGARNWLIGSIGSIKNGTAYVGPHDPGTYDSSGSSATNVFPNSLYYAQMQDRLAAPNLQTREYWIGEINQFTNSVPSGESVTVDSTWKASIQAAASGAAVNGFDVVSNNQWVPFTFDFNLATNEQVVAASLTVALRAVSGASSNDVLYVDSLTNVFALTNLAWAPLSATNATVGVLDLSGQLGLLADGKLNLAVQNDVGIDWALLQLQVAPVLQGATNVTYPVADATVRGGASANGNFGTATTLTVKEDSSNDNDRKAFLRWDLTSVTGTVYSARIRLTPLTVGTDGIEQAVAVSTNDSWSEASITWNNQPFVGKRFATWIPATNAPLEFVVTPQVLEALAGDKQLSIQLLSVRSFGSAGNVDYASREHPDVNARPQLRLFMAGAAPVISDITNRTAGVGASTGPIPFTVGDASTAATNLVMSAASSDPSLVPAPNIVFGGSGSNRTVTLTPAPASSGVVIITVTVTDGDGLSASDDFTLTIGNHVPAVLIWNGPGAGLNGWAVTGNWSPVGPPETFDDVKFFDTGASGVGVSNINNVVDAGFGGTIASLQYGNTNGNHTTLIPAGRTLNVVGATGITVGTETDNGNTQVVNSTMTGAGALNVNGGSVTIRQATDPSSSSQRATLDLSGLDRFNATVDRVLIGTEGAIARPTGTLLLAKTNFITMVGSSPSLAIGGAAGGSGNAGGASHIFLGRTNTILTSGIAIGRVKQGTSGGVSSSIRFNPLFTNANPTLGAKALFRAADGVSRVTSWSIADAGSQGGTENTAGICDFSGGNVDVQVDTLLIGRSSTGSGAGTPVGGLVLHGGVIDANTMQLGIQGSVSANSGNNFATGTINVNGGTLIVNGALQLGPTAGGNGVVASRGVVAINGGTVRVNSIVTGAGTNNTITVNNGTLILTNTAGPGINMLTLTNAALSFRVSTNGARLGVTNLITGAAISVINIAAVPPITGNPAQFPLIKYSGAVGGAGFNLALGTLPPGAACGGYLSNNVTAQSIDLVLTNCAPPDPFLTWNGNESSEWDTLSENWKNNVEAGLIYFDGNMVVFNDTATGGTDINLLTSLSPSSVVVSNDAKAYSFNGLGGLTGTASLVKRGSGMFVIANGGDNDFTGGITIEAGTLQVGNGGGDGSVPSGPISNNAALVFNLSDDVVVNSIINGSGSVIQDGPNELTLSGASTFGGLTIIRNGAIKIGNAAALGASSTGTIITNGGTLDVNGFNLGAEPIVVSGNGETNSGAIANYSGNPVFLNQNLAYVTLAGDTTFGGTGRWDLRSANTSVTNAVLSTTGHAYKLTKAGTNQISFVGVFVDPLLGDIDVQSGILSVEKVTTSLGNPLNTLTLRSNATLQLLQVSNVLSKVLVMEDGAAMLNNSGTNTFGGVITLQGSNAFSIGGTWLKLTNAINGVGGLAKFGGGQLVLSGSNTYSGSTSISLGTLALTNSGSIFTSSNIVIDDSATLNVSGRVDGKLTLAVGQMLSGDGALSGALHVNPGATVSPGASIGTLTISGTVVLLGNTVMEVNKDSFTNDLVAGATSISYGGSLFVTNLGGDLISTDTFKLFSAGSYSGQFATIIPPSPGPGLTWNTNTLAADGMLRIAAAPSQPSISSIRRIADNVVINGTGGTPLSSYHVLASTNLALPLATWTVLMTNAFDAAGNFSATNPINSAAPLNFYLLRVP